MAGSVFDARMRISGESVAAIADDLLLLARRAHPNLDRKSVKQLALQQFYKSLEPQLKWRCIERDCRSLGEAVELVETYESVMGQRQEKNC